MKKQIVRSWVDESLVENLHKIRNKRPNLPTIQTLAVWALRLGIDGLLQDYPIQSLKVQAKPGGPRRTLTLRLSRDLHRGVLKICQDRPDASSISSAVRLALWVGLNRLIEQELPRQAA